MAAAAVPKLWDRLQNYLGPGVLIAYAVYYFAKTILTTIFIDLAPQRLLFNPSEIRAKAFSSFWLAIFAPPVSNDNANDNDTTNLSPPPPPIFPTLAHILPTEASGKVLEIGPGTGPFLRYLTASSITHIYGAEPMKDLHPALLASAAAAGFSEKYTALACSGEKASLLPTLINQGILAPPPPGESAVPAQGVFDTIVCIRVLCSVQNPPETIANLYDLLKPGGKLIICEHVVNPWWTSRKGGVVGRCFQAVWPCLGWTFFLGGCRMTQDTVGILRRVGEEDERRRGKAEGRVGEKKAGGKKAGEKGMEGWERVELETSGEWGVLPFVTGVWVKK